MIIIGEKINGTIPGTGKAIAERDEAYIRELAVAQSEAGANFIDVCAGVSPDVEIETLKWLIGIVQSATDVPICIDSPSPHTIAVVLGDIEKPGLINAVSLEGDKLDIIFPLIVNTPWQCVALLCDDDGIPSTVLRRLEIAEIIIGRANAMGIALERLYIDPLVIALAADGASMSKFSQCAWEIKVRDPSIHITGGLSNISLGLPLRRSINLAFLTLAMNAGMDSVIMDPTNRELLAALLSTDALLENGRYCMR